MKHWEEYYYESDSNYSADEIKQIRHLIRKGSTINCVFLPIFTFTLMGLITLVILSFALNNKTLEKISLYVTLLLLAVSLLWGFFYYQNSQKRIRLMKEIGNKYKKPC